MAFLLITGIVIGILIIQSLLGKYKDIVNIIAVVAFIIWQFNLSSNKESNVKIESKKENKIEFQNIKRNSYDSNYLNSSKENSTYSKQYLEYKKKYNSNKLNSYNNLLSYTFSFCFI
ncbi:hypothetical protein [Polaribacter sejongensis]|uniref:hypothetical protein n=1 Tax=Polaribacter sejongensis TaxID=985043 RepID=UPI0030F82C0A